MLESLLAQLTFTKVLLAFLILRYLLNALLYHLETRKFHRIGGTRAPIRPLYLPMGIDMLYRAIKNTIQNRNLEFWQSIFRDFGNGGYTCEVGTAGTRAVLTADPEIIKAILAKQFADFGKGENFRRDFHDFLGDGGCSFLPFLVVMEEGQVWKSKTGYVMMENTSRDLCNNYRWLRRAFIYGRC